MVNLSLNTNSNTILARYASAVHIFVKCSERVSFKMVLVGGLCLLLLVSTAATEDVGSNGDQPEGRDLRDYNDQDWKAVELTPTPETSGWIPEEQVTRRRRIRKRKRRPPVIEDQLQEESIAVRRRTRPQRLDQIKEPWEDISDEMTQRTYNRRRLTPVYEEEPKREKIRDPFTALQEAEEKQKKKVEESTNIPDLKTLLKQSGGLSLSEVLQQKNLSLTELLRGNQDAISAIASEATTEPTSTERNKWRRFPAAVSKKDEFDGLSSQEIMEAQRRRFALLQNGKESKIFADVTRYDVVTEETTERRIFVPSNSKLYTSVDYKPTFVLKEVTTPLSTTEQVRSRELPMTSAKLKKVVSKLEPRIPPKAVKIDINEIFGFDVFQKKNDTTDGPFKMSIDLGEIATTEIIQEEENVVRTTVAPVIEELKITTAATLSEKLKHVTAKEEIMELLNNPYDREELAKILERRNMTVEELVALRERGASQLHLADIFHNKTREPEPKGEPIVANINSDSFFNRKSKNMPLAPTTPRPTIPFITTRPPYTITSFPTYKIETNKNSKPQPFPGFWKQLYPSFFPDVYDNRIHEDRGKATTSTTTSRIIYELDDLEDLENTLTANRKVNVGLSPQVYEDNEFIGLPSGVKSAIFASLAIIGLSLLVFLTILVIFKWTQKQKRRLNYTGSFSGSKIKSPILEPDQRRTFKTFMVETLGRKKNFYKSHLQNMSDSFWDTESEKKAYMLS